MTKPIKIINGEIHQITEKEVQDAEERVKGCIESRHMTSEEIIETRRKQSKYSKLVDKIIGDLDD